ncbi:MAG: hypothetical protein ACRC9R_05425 [Enterovibrio sp.]
MINKQEVLKENPNKSDENLMNKENKHQEIKINDTILGGKMNKIVTNNRTVSAVEEFIKQKESVTKIYMVLTFIVAFSIFIFAASVNQDVFKLEKETSEVLNQAINATVLLVIPFLLGAIGGLTCILLSELRVKAKGTLSISAGLMAVFSWIAIKSEFFLAIVSPSADIRATVAAMETVGSTGFYSSSLVAILVGIFTTNMYLSVNRRVEFQLAKMIKEGMNNNNKDKSSQDD